MNMMLNAFRDQSPRLRRRAVPLAARVVRFVPVAMFVALLAQAFVRTGIASWSVGVA